MALSSLVDAELVFRKTYPFRPRQYTSSPMEIDATTGSRSGLVRPLPEHPLHPLYRWRDHLCLPGVPRGSKNDSFSPILTARVARCFSLFFRTAANLCFPYLSTKAATLLLYRFGLRHRYRKFPDNNLSTGRWSTALITISVCGLIHAFRGKDEDPVISIGLVDPSPPIEVSRYRQKFC